MKPKYFILTALLIQSPLLVAVEKASDARLDEVAAKGRTVMPFNLEQTLHVFSKNKQGGIQQVMVKNVADTAQISLIQQHLSKIYTEFKRGDYSDPKKIHGSNMPGLKAIQAAKPGEISLQYQSLKDGAEITYSTEKPELITAIHQWFDAQLSDHARHSSMHRLHHSNMHPMK